jgi:hypothetical protein
MTINVSIYQNHACIPEKPVHAGEIALNKLA